MKRLMSAALWLAFVSAPGWGQIRNITINTSSEPGKLLQQAADEKDSNKKIALYEEFLSKFPSDEAEAYVHFQLQNEYLKVNNFDKSLEHGQAAQAKAPEDLEVAHFLVKAAEGKGDAQALVAAVEKAHALAQKVSATPKPSQENEVEAWKRNTDFAGQVDQYNEYALYESSQKQTSAQAKIVLFDALRKYFPNGQFSKSLDAQYVVAYQKLGDNQKMLQAMEAALATDPTNEGYLYLIAENNMDPAKGKLGVAQANAEKILQTLPGKPKPAAMSEEEWTKYKENYLGRAHFVLGRIFAEQNKFGPAQKELLAAASALKGNNDVLGGVYYFLGLSSAKLNRQAEAVNYLTQSSKIPGPYQAYAADTLKKIRAALAGR
jgi:tetratricopeptide (TPR) repeat protein